MSEKVIITKLEQQNLLVLMDQDDKLLEIHFFSDNQSNWIGNIYIGKVVNVLKGMNAAFVNIGMDKNAYLPIENSSKILFTNQKKGKKLTQGDEIVVQVIKERTKTKGPVVSTSMSLTGKYVVLTANKNFIGISNKITKKEERKRLKEIIQPFVCKNYGFIIRTNCLNVEQSVLINEINLLISDYYKIKKDAAFRTCYQKVYGQGNPIIHKLKDFYDNKLGKIITDNEHLYREIKNYFPISEGIHNKVKLYHDPKMPLINLYGIKSKIKKALNEKVWLKSGGYLIIQPTEALISIDVNTGKYLGKKNFEQTIFNINMEAAKEIAKQLRLRNLSGIIIVDFIDMKDKAHKVKLLQYFQRHLSKDRIKTCLEGMTRLGLVELTRKRVNKPLYEKAKEIGIDTCL